MPARHPDRHRHRGRQLHRHLPEPVIGHARHALHPRCTEARTTRARRRRSPVGDQVAVAFRADCLIRGPAVPSACGCCPMALAFLSRVPASAGSDPDRTPALEPRRRPERERQLAGERRCPDRRPTEAASDQPTRLRGGRGRWNDGTTGRSCRWRRRQAWADRSPPARGASTVW